MTAVFSPTDLVLRDAAGRPVRDSFPLLAARDVAYLDHAASAQKPAPVLDAWRRFQETSYANVHRGAFPISEEATDAYERARARVAAFLGVSADGLVFVRGATEGLNLAAHALLSGQEGVPVALTELDHHANLVPWHFQGVGREGRHRLVPVRVDASTGALSRPSLSAAFADARIWALPHVSNVTGATLDLAEVGRHADVAGAILVVDGCQALSKGPGPLPRGVAAYAVSAHKAYGPTGVGALWVEPRRLARWPAWQGGGGMIREVSLEATRVAAGVQRFEAGTPAISEAVAFAAALDWLEGLGLEAVRAHARACGEALAGMLDTVPGVRRLPGEPSSGVVSFTVEGVHPHDAATLLGRLGVCVRAGQHCAQPLMTALGLETGCLRASCAVHTVRDDLDRLVRGIAQVRGMLA
jgi:cysteine desulfurase/selenocysteine lyase